MNCRRNTSSNDGDIINLSSMIDVMFILIIFFLVTTTFKEEEIDHMVNLPVDARNQSLTQSTGNIAKINIRKDGSYIVQGKQLNQDEVTEWTKTQVDKKPDLNIRETALRKEVMNALHQWLADRELYRDFNEFLRNS